MGLKTYIGASLLLLIVVWGVVFSIEPANYELKVFDFSITLLISIWVLLPAIILFVLSVLHLIFYGTLNYCKLNGYKKDEESIIEVIKSLLLEKSDNRKFKTSSYKNLSSILKQFKLDVTDNTFTSKSESLNDTVSKVKDIKAGKHVVDKSLKLPADSALAQQNLINKVNEQVDYAVEILKRVDQHSPEVVRAAFFNVLENKSMTTIKKIYSGVTLDKEMALKLFLKDIDNIEFGLSKEEILKITKSLNYSKEEYITLAKLYKEVLSPDKLLELFEILSNDTEVAMDAYFYVLLELEMIEKLKDLLSGYGDEEHIVFRALLDLKDAGKHYSLDDIVIV
ncbi:MAG: hypothetical protein ACNI25_11680 [Halarcobacter sp.]